MKKIYFISIFFLLLISRLYAYANLQWEIDDYGTFSMSGITDLKSVGLNYLALCIGLMLAIKSSTARLIWRKNIPIYVIVIIGVCIWTLHSMLSIGMIETLYASTSPIVYLIILLMLLGGESEYWAILKKIAPIMAIIYIALAYSMYMEVESIVHNAKLTGNNPVTSLYVSAIWWIAICVIDFYEYNFIYKLYVFILIGCSGLFAFMLTYRSWMIQSILLFAFALFQSGRSRVEKIFIAILIVGGVSVLSNHITSYIAWDEHLNDLSEKMETDTRTFQYEEIFSGTPLYTWLIGGGINATYKSSLNGNTTSIDNQYLFLIFHYGLWFAIPYIWILFSSWINLFLRKNISWARKNLVIIAIMWCMALGGLSVFNAISFNSQTFILSIVLGRCVYLSSQKTAQIKL